MQNRIDLTTWIKRLKTQSEDKRTIYDKNSYILSLAHFIEALRLEKTKGKLKHIQQIIYKYSSERIPLTAPIESFRQKITSAKKQIHIKLASNNKICNAYETNFQGKDITLYKTALRDRKILRADRAILHLLEPLKNYNIEMLVDWYYHYELIHPSFETTFHISGVGTKYFDSFLTLNRTQAGVNIPDIRLAGISQGYPDYYIKKIPVENLEHAVFAALLGKYTDCCQSYSGAAGESCVKHGLTSPDGAFYILLKKERILCAQAWTWREKNKICFDSIEPSAELISTEDLLMADRMFSALAAEMIIKDPRIEKVTNGYYKTFSESLGYISTYSLHLSHLNPKTYNGHYDSVNQHMLSEQDLLFPILALDKKMSDSSLECELKKLTQTPLYQIKKLKFTIGFAKQNKQKSMLDNIINTANTLNVLEPVEKYIQIQDIYLNEQKKYVEYPDEKVMIDFIQRHPVDIDLFDIDQPLFIEAAKHGHYRLIDLMLEKKADVNTVDRRHFTALYYASEHGHERIVTQLIDCNANMYANLQNIKPEDTALTIAVSNKNFNILNILIIKDPRPQNHEQKIHDTTIAAKTAITFRLPTYLSLLVSTRSIDYSKISCPEKNWEIRDVLFSYTDLPYPENTIGKKLIHSLKKIKTSSTTAMIIEKIYRISDEHHIDFSGNNKVAEVETFKKKSTLLINENKLTTPDRIKFFSAFLNICSTLKIKTLKPCHYSYKRP
jgi:hypothetical protein